MKFTDDLIETTGTIPTITVRYARETHGQPVFIHGFDGLEIERKLGRDSKISYDKSEIRHKPAVFIGGVAQIDDTPGNRLRIAQFCQEKEFLISREDWERIDGEALLEGGEAEEAEIEEVVVEEKPKKKKKVQRKKTSVNSKNVDDSDKEEKTEEDSAE